MLSTNYEGSHATRQAGGAEGQGQSQHLLTGNSHFIRLSHEDTLSSTATAFFFPSLSFFPPLYPDVPFAHAMALDGDSYADATELVETYGVQRYL